MKDAKSYIPLWGPFLDPICSLHVQHTSDYSLQRFDFVLITFVWAYNLPTLPIYQIKIIFLSTSIQSKADVIFTGTI